MKPWSRSVVTLAALVAMCLGSSALPAAADTLRWTDCPEETIGAVPAVERHKYDWERQVPTFGRGHAFGAVFCATWPARRHPTAALRQLSRSGHQLRVQPADGRPARRGPAGQRRRLRTHQPRPPRPPAERLRQAIAARYLIDLALPPPGTVCPADTQPFQD